jgi:hypothetical protein
LNHTERRRARRGSLDRPINGRLYRGSWLLVAPLALIAAFTIENPPPLPEPRFPATFDQASATYLARELPLRFPDRSPGSAGALGAADWFSDQLRPYGLRTRRETFTETIPGRGRVVLRNLSAMSPGRSPSTIVVMAHRDNTGSGPGANDNASGTAALIEIARAYARATTGRPGGVRPEHTIVFLSTDGGAWGGLGAERFARRSLYRDRVVAVLNLDSFGTSAPPRLELAGDTPRSPAAVLVATAARRILEETGARPEHVSWAGQLLDLAFPFTLYEQGPFVSRGISALTLTTAGSRPPDPQADTPDGLDTGRLAELGRAAERLLVSLDAGLELTQATSSYVYFGPRLARGWALQLVFVAMLLPFLLTTIDLYARCRRRGISIAPAIRSYRTRLAYWLWAGALFGAFAWTGAFPGGAARPINPDSSVAGDWKWGVILALASLLLVSWLVGRQRLIPRRQSTVEEELAGFTAALVALGAVGLLVVATNPYALIFVLPSLHAWLWLPNLRDRPAIARLATLVFGFAGPALLLGVFAARFELGLDAPWYLAELAAIGYVPVVGIVLFLAWLAGCAQILTLVAGRYAAYPSRYERPSSGLVRTVARMIVMRRRPPAPRQPVQP